MCFKIFNYCWQLDNVFNWVTKMGLSHMGVHLGASMTCTHHHWFACCQSQWVCFSFCPPVSWSPDRIWRDIPLPPSGTPSSFRSYNTIFFQFFFQFSGYSLCLSSSPLPNTASSPSGLSTRSLLLCISSPVLSCPNPVGLETICSLMIPKFISAVQTQVIIYIWKFPWMSD